MQITPKLLKINIVYDKLYMLVCIYRRTKMIIYLYGGIPDEQ